MEVARLKFQELASIALDWATVAGFFAAQAFVATGGVQRLVFI